MNTNTALLVLVGSVGLTMVGVVLMGIKKKLVIGFFLIAISIGIDIWLYKM